MVTDLRTESPPPLAARARVFKALGHPSRLRMVEALARGERCVCELRNLIGDDMSTVSKHLRVLKDAGLIVDDKRGVQVFYRLRLPCVVGFFDCVDAVLKEPRATGERCRGR